MYLCIVGNKTIPRGSCVNVIWATGGTIRFMHGNTECIMSKDEFLSMFKEVCNHMIFDENRRAIAVIGDWLVISPKGDTRTCRTWIREDLYVDPLTITRGYMLPGRIQFFTGGAFSPSVGLTENQVESAIRLYHDIYGVDDVPMVCNGCHMGEIGEQWQPILVLDSMMHWVICDKEGHMVNGT